MIGGSLKIHDRKTFDTIYAKSALPLVFRKLSLNYLDKSSSHIGKGEAGHDSDVRYPKF